MRTSNPLSKINIAFLIFFIMIVTAIVLGNSSWKLRVKGSNKEVATNPIIKGTSVFVDIYDLSNLFNIDYEVNLTRKYVLFHKIPTVPNQLPQQTKQTTQNPIPKDQNLISSTPKVPEQSINTNHILYTKLSEVKTIVISNPIDEVKKLDDNNYKTYTEDFENLDNIIKSSFTDKSFKTIVFDKNFKLDKFDIKLVSKYLFEKNIDGAIIPVVKKYYYFEKEGNALVPTVEIQINYIFINKQGEILFFNVQNISRSIAVLSSGSVRYRKSKLLDLSKMSVEFFIRDYQEYYQILEKQ
ncbi:MAG: hypothetical protein RMJ36_02365 [Candidatus Calescibacterium sp.]|nr:hypothetical protein [Candidatus Calescibacterium sp.]MDW8132482.1 hypothetical protein [Candidatus Calescibacterium sp.]